MNKPNDTRNEPIGKAHTDHANIQTDKDRRNTGGVERKTMGDIDDERTELEDDAQDRANDAEQLGDGDPQADRSDRTK